MNPLEERIQAAEKELGITTMQINRLRRKQRVLEDTIAELKRHK